MIGSDVGAIANGVTSVATLIGDALSRGDRDKPDAEFDERIAKIQKAFKDQALDSVEFLSLIDELFQRAGFPLTPTGDIGFGRIETLHSFCVALCCLIRERQYAARYVARVTSIGGPGLPH